MKKMSPPALLKFVRRFDSVARLGDDGQTVQIVSPRLDCEGRFIRLYANFARPGRLLLHDDAYTLSARIKLAEADLAEANVLLAFYGLDPLRASQDCLQIWIKAIEDYPSIKTRFENAVLILTKSYGRFREKPERSIPGSSNKLPKSNRSPYE